MSKMRKCGLCGSNGSRGDLHPFLQRAYAARQAGLKMREPASDYFHKRCGATVARLLTLRKAGRQK